MTKDAPVCPNVIKLRPSKSKQTPRKGSKAETQQSAAFRALESATQKDRLPSADNEGIFNGRLSYAIEKTDNRLGRDFSRVATPRSDGKQELV